MAKQEIRSVGPLPIIHIVDPPGNILAIGYAKGIGGKGSRLVDYEAGVARLSHLARDKGYITLREAYRDDPRKQLKENGLRIYRTFFVAAKNKKTDRIHIKLRNDTVRSASAPFPAKFLPQEVMKRRGGYSDVSTEMFEMPDLEFAELDEKGNVMTKAQMTAKREADEKAAEEAAADAEVRQTAAAAIAGLQDKPDAT